MVRCTFPLVASHCPLRLSRDHPALIRRLSDEEESQSKLRGAIPSTLEVDSRHANLPHSNTKKYKRARLAVDGRSAWPPISWCPPSRAGRGLLHVSALGFLVTWISFSMPRRHMDPEDMSKFSVGAVVVLFHPDLPQLHRLYECLQSQVDLLWFIDNTPASTGERFPISHGEPAWNVLYRGLGQNIGIAAAQNLGIREAIACRCDHVLLLDQDSFLPTDTVRKLLSAERYLLGRGVRVAAVGPVFVDQKTGLAGKSHHHRWFRLHKPSVDLCAQVPEETDWLIASGSLIHTRVLTQVGAMREELFIDAVDMEWGMRARSQGFRSFLVPSAQISHSVGDAFVRLLGVSVILHSEVRNYYICRNWLYLLRFSSMGARWRSGALLHLTKFFGLHCWLSLRRQSQVAPLGRGLRDGFRGVMGPYRP